MLHGHVPKTVSRLKPVERLPGTQHLRLAVCLPLRNQLELAELLRQLSDPASPNYRQYLTPEQFTDRFGPSKSDYQAVIEFAKANGLSVKGVHPNRMLVDVEGTVSDIEKALHVTMRNYQHPNEARKFYAPDTEPSVELSVSIMGISGLNNYSLPRPRFRSNTAAAKSYASPNAGSAPNGGYMGDDFRTAYAPGTSLTGSGQTVGLLQFDGYAASDIAYYENLTGRPNVTLTNVLLDGFSGTPTGTGGEVEVCLDIEMVISMAPGVSNIIVYEAGPSGNWHDILNRIATDNLARQISCSWYSPGGAADPTADQIFQQMAAQGQSFFSASGDDDAFTDLIPFPGDTPYITEVGGTTLTTGGSGGFWGSETVWNWNTGIGSGGGISTQYSIPAWQQGISMTACLGSTTMRNVPDVALTADNVYVRADGMDKNVGGTSCAAPLWAAFTALINQQSVANGRATVGFINPAVYAIGKGTDFASDFHDTTTGNNYSSGSPARFPAATGYDLCTGWGTPAGGALIDALAGPQDNLQVSFPTLTTSGTVGGPFAPASQNYSLVNSGAGSISWSVSKTQSWLSLSATGGTLAAGGSTTMIASLNANANSLGAGSYSDTITFSDLTTGINQTRTASLTVTIPAPIMSITPATGFSPGGLPGGPFYPSGSTYTVANTGNAPLNWAVSNTSNWMTVSLSGGTLSAGGSTTVLANITSAANSLASGSYGDTLAFTNLTNGIGNTALTCRLNVGLDFFTELFSPPATSNDVHNNTFTLTPNGSANYYSATRISATSFPTDPAGGTSLAMGDDTYASVTLSGSTVSLYGTSYNTFFVGSNGYITFDSGDTTYVESTSAHFSKPRISALFDDLYPSTGMVTWKQLGDRVAVTWQNVPEYGTGNSNSFQIEMFFDGRIRITLLGVAATDGLIGLSRGTGIPTGFVMSDFTTYPGPQQIAISIPASATEGDGVLAGAGSVTATPAPSSALTVNLVSSDVTEVSVPATVTIPAGQATTSFDVTILDDAILDGSQTVVITSSAAGYSSQNASIVVNDNESASLGVILPASAREGDPAVTGTVTLSGVAGKNVAVTLSSSNLTKAVVPATVVIPAGQSSALFPLTIIDNNIIDGTIPVTITAHVANWTDGTAIINVLDNENSNLGLSLPVQIIEGGSATCTVSTSGILTSPLTVSLSSDTPSRLTVPASVTIPAGAGSATFTAVAPDNNIADGTQTVTVTASATGFTGTSGTTSVLDNEVDHFTFSTVPSPQIANAAFNVTITARDASNEIVAGFTGTVGLAANAGLSVTPVTSGTFSNGVWTGAVSVSGTGAGVILTATSVAGAIGQSNAFQVLDSSVTSDAFLAFSTDTNPSPGGYWKYGYANTLGGAFNLYTITGSDTGGITRSWSGPTNPPSVVKNVSGTDWVDANNVLYPGTDFLNLNPGPAGQYSVTRWTAATSGTYQLATTFKSLRVAVQAATTDVHVLKNSVSIFDGTISSFVPWSDQSFAMTLPLSAGDTIDFVVGRGTNNDSSYDSTGLKASIAPLGTTILLKTGIATELAVDAAALEGSVFLNGVSGTSYFQYGTTSSYGSVTAPQLVGSGTSVATTTGTAAGLALNTLYHYRAVAITASGTGYGLDQTFTTFTPVAAYDAFNDFSANTNPGLSGTWRYGYTAVLGGSFTLYTVSGSDSICRWWNVPAHEQLVDKNVTGTDYIYSSSYILSPGARFLQMHPGSAGEYSATRWTAATYGTYQIISTFKSLRIGYIPTTTDVHVLKSGSSIFNGTINSYEPWSDQCFTRTMSLNAGDTIDFVVGTGGNGYGYDTTGLRAAITFFGTPGLNVTPVADLASTGTLGGPFSPAGSTYTLINTETGPINWTVSGTSNWLAFTPASGTIDSGSSVILTATVNGTANTLNTGIYIDTITFANTTDGQGNTTRAATLTVLPPPPLITSAVATSGAYGVMFSYQIVATNSPTSYGAAGLPSGLSVNTSTGLISGTPTQTGTFNASICAINAGGTGSAILALTVLPPPPPGITSSTAASGTFGFAFNYQIVAGNSPTSYGATGLPSGLSVNTLTGLISGTPAQSGTFNSSISAINIGGTGSATLVLTILPPPPPGITSSTAASGTFGLAFNYQITATNSPASYGATGLPSGLSVSNSTGLISGTPAQTGTFTPTINAINIGGTGSATLILTILPPPRPVITSSATASGTSGFAFNYQITATNSPASYGASGLPSGLSVSNSTGLISGTPAQTGTFYPTISATNVGGTGSATLALTVLSPPPAIFDAFLGFSADTNPSPGGYWRYGYTTTLGGVFNLYTTTGSDTGGITRSWSGSTNPPSVIKNISGTDWVDGNNVLYPGTDFLNLNPGPTGQYSVTRWTASTSGTYQLAATFKSLRVAVQAATTDVHVLKNSVSIFDGTISSFVPWSDQSFAMTLPLSAGDTIDFVVGRGPNNDSSCDSTGLKASIAPLGTTILLKTGIATELAVDTAALEGSVFLNGVGGTSYFQYGTTSSYGSVTAPQPIGSGTSVMTITGTAAGLALNTLYHYRAVAITASGTGYGLDQTFATFTPVAACDAFNDFSVNTNPGPSGTWRYGYATALGGSFILYTTYSSDAVTKAWCVPNYQLVEKNLTGTDYIYTSQYVLLPGSKFLGMHPGPYGEYSITRWTASVSGTYQIASTFKSLRVGVAPATTDVHVMKSGSSIFNGAINSYEPWSDQCFTRTMVLNSGDTIDFAVGYGNGNYSCDSTGLRAAITFFGTPGLNVTPAAGLVSTGTQGGPFSPAGSTYTLISTETSPINWTVSGTSNWLTFTPASGTIASGSSTTVTVTVNGTANTLGAGSYGGTIAFANTTDGLGNTTRTVSLTVLPPPPAITSAVATSGTYGAAFSYQIIATNSPTGFNATGLPSGLNVNTSTGLISGTPTQIGMFNSTISAINAGGTGSAVLALTVLPPPPPAITSSTSASGNLGLAFSYQIAATNSPTSYGATGLPSGLSVNTLTGLISGTPAQTGSFNPTISAINAGGTGSAVLALTMLPPPPPVITSSTTANGIFGLAFNYQILATNSPASYSATGLPSGLVINNSTGLISGTPAQTGIFNSTISAFNTGGTGSATLALIVLPMSAIFDAFLGFSTDTNPSPGGYWRYGYTTTLGGAFNLYATTGSDSGGITRSWSYATNPCVVKNVSGTDWVDANSILYPGADFLNMHPGPAGQYSVTRWTASTSGTYQLAAAFKSLRTAVQAATTDIHVLLNSVSIFDGTINSFVPWSDQSFAKTLPLNAGDTIDFAVGCGPNNDYTCDSTGLKASIAPLGTTILLKTGIATELAADTAALEGSAYLNGVSGTSYFQYGTTSSYGSVTTPQPVGSGTSVARVTGTAAGLALNTLYHYRAVAITASGTGYGLDQPFTTFTPASSSDAFNDFSVNTNPGPGGTWRYGYTTTLGGSYTLYTGTAYDANCRTWWVSTNQELVEKNITGTDFLYTSIYVLAPGARFLMMHPGAAGEYSITRWTAVTSGTYQIASTFKSLRVGYVPTTTDVHVLKSGSSVFNGAINSYEPWSDQCFTRTMSLNAGDTIDFVVGTGGNGYGYDTTGLRAAITFFGTPVLSVTPSVGLNATGTFGGPFTPPSASYTLTNSGTGLLNWQAGNTSGWLSLSSTGGMLDTGSSTTVIATLNSNANALTPGINTDAITFINLVNGCGNTSRYVSLQVIPDTTPPVLLVTTPDHSTTSQPAITLLGTAFDPSGIASVAANGVTATTSDNFAHWSATISSLSTGVNVITVIATDGASPANTASVTRQVLCYTGNSSLFGDGLPDAWKIAHGLDPFDNTGVNSPTGNPSGDGISNLMKYALNLDPQQNGTAGLPFATTAPNPADSRTYLIFNYRRIIGGGGLTYIVESSTDLAGWTSLTSDLEEISATPDIDGVTEDVQVRLHPSLDTSSTQAKFIRLRVTAP